ncbi:hypothetical protein ACHAWF_003363 [Thalassiosira exigua]
MVDQMPIHFLNSKGMDHEIGTEWNRPDGDIPVRFSTAEQMPIHMLQFGPARTATTLQYMCVCLSLLLKLDDSEVFVNGSQMIKQLQCFYSDGSARLHRNILQPRVFKSHQAASHFGSNKTKEDIPIFTTAATKRDAVKLRSKLTNDGFKKVMYVQDLETVAERGHHIIDDYAHIFSLSSFQRNELLEYMRYWDILRICCGKQMSNKWRMEQWPEWKIGKEFIDTHDPRYPACSMFNIDEVERLFLNTTLHKRIKGHSIAAGVRHLNGTYCSCYNKLVKTQGVEFNKGEVRRN